MITNFIALGLILQLNEHECALPLRIAQAARPHGVSSITMRLGILAGIPVASDYARLIPDQEAYIRVPREETLKSVGLTRGSSVTGPYLLHRADQVAGPEVAGATMSIVGSREKIDIRVAAEHIKKIHLERELTGQAPASLFLGEIRYSSQHADEDGAYARIHIGSSIPYDEFHAAVRNGVPYGGRTAEQVVADINKYLSDLYRLKYLPGAVMRDGAPVLGIPVSTAFGYYKNVFGSLPGAIMIRTGDGGSLADKASVNAALDALESIMKEAGAKDFGRVFPRIRKIVGGQGDGGEIFTHRRGGE